MSLNSINTNIAAYSAQSNIGKASTHASSSIARLSSGNRIVRAADDVASLSVGTSLRTGVTTLRQALANTTQGSSLLQVADGALGQVSEILQRQKAIAVQANSGTLSDTERAYLNQEFQVLKSQIDQISSSTSFSSVNLLDGSLSGSNPLRSAANGTATITGATAQTGIASVAFADVAGGTVGDTSFSGDLSKGIFEVQSDGADAYTISYSLNGSTYVGYVADIDTTGAAIDLSNGEGKITFTVDADLLAAGYTKDAAGAAAFETALTDFFSDATSFANRTIRTTDATVDGKTIEGSSIKETDTLGTILAGMAGDNVTIRSEFWNGVNAPTISDFTSSGNGIGAKFSVNVDGKTYTTKVASADMNDLDTDNLFGDGAGVMRFYLDGDATTNPNEYVSISFTGLTNAAYDASTEEGVAGLTSALNDVFGRSGGGLTLQVGSKSTDTLSVNLKSVDTSQLYVNDDAEFVALDVTTISGAREASNVLDNAIGKINQVRADVGALQSRVDFTAANLESSIQNQDAARGTLLDTDVAAESTAYATAQVQLQAGIAVLAQANQLPQNLLKLIS